MLSKKRITYMVSLAVMLFLFGRAGYSEIYKYQDENGTWKFTDTPPAEEARDIEIMAGMADSASGIKDIRQMLLQKFSPQNRIEEATLSAVKIASSIGTGSGFFITENGHILTNRHVIYGDKREAQRAEETFERVDAEIQFADTQFDYEAKKLVEAGGYLEEMKKEIDALPDRSSRKSSLEKKYENDMAYYATWKERHEAEKRRYEEEKDKYAGEKSDFKSRMASAGAGGSYKITLKNGDELDAWLVRASEDADLALLKVNGCISPAIKRATADVLAQGQTVLAIGSPLSLSDSVSRGIVSGFRDGYIQTDAKIYPGNSGGPLVLEDGRVVGINTMKMLTHGFEGLGFAIPISIALQEFRNELGKQAGE